MKTRHKDNGVVVYKGTRTYSGVPCQKCNNELRYESSGGCVSCTQKEAREAYRRFPDRQKEDKKIYYLNNKDTHRNLVLLSTYGISLKEYNCLLRRQNYACAICKKECSTGRNLCVDHDHIKGGVRGLLCLNCNRAIGNMRDDYLLLMEASNYIKKYDNKIK